jgi:hypothetical protein
VRGRERGRERLCVCKKRESVEDETGSKDALSLSHPVTKESLSLSLSLSLLHTHTPVVKFLSGPEEVD